MTTPIYTKNDLRQIYARLQSLLPPGAAPLTADGVVAVTALLAKTGEIIKTAPDATERGALILSWRVPSELAPTMNAFAYMKGWQKAKISRELEGLLQKIVDVTPGAKVHGLTTQRWVRVTRFTPNIATVDDPSAIDTIGGKLLLDRLVDFGILVDDKPSFCRREGMVRPTHRGNTHVLVEVFAVAAEEVPDPGPVDGLCEKPTKTGRKNSKVAKLLASELASHPTTAKMIADVINGPIAPMKLGGNKTRTLDTGRKLPFGDG